MNTGAGLRELTVDELAAEVGMTVRNVRAYAGRGLIHPPRLAGRTGYYSSQHVARLHLIRELIDRGYTLAAVEKALVRQTGGSADQALDLIRVLDKPLQDAEQPEVMTRDALTALAGIDRDDDLVTKLTQVGLAEQVDDDHLMISSPTVVRAGAQAIALGLEPDSVLALLPVITQHMGVVADAFVAEVRTQIWYPFVARGMPDDEWPRILTVIETLLPVAAQAVFAVFRNELSHVVMEAMGEELEALGTPVPPR